MQVTSMTVGSMSVCCYIAVCDTTHAAVIIDPGGDETEGRIHTSVAGQQGRSTDACSIHAAVLRSATSSHA